MNFSKITFEDVGFARPRISFLHSGRDIGSGAFEIGKKANIRILLPRFVGVVSAFADIYNEKNDLIKQITADSIRFDGYTDDEINFALDVKGLGVGLYYLRFRVSTAAGDCYIYRSGRAGYLSCEEHGTLFQFSVVDFPKDSPSSLVGGIIYHVFVDRFKDSGKTAPREDAVMIEDWEAIPEYPEYPGAHLENNTFFGGDLYGVIEKLDYIKSLGTTLIYLSPIFEAYSNHKYDTGDYMKVDSMFGSDAALAELIAEADKRGIGIILDGVFNHTGADSVYFNKNGRYATLGAYQSVNSPYYDWYDFQSFPDKYTCWWGIKILPRINPEVSSCGSYIAGDGGVIEKYTKMGVRGFRLDVADELSDDFIAKIKSKLTSVRGDAILYGEVWEDASNKIAYDKRKKYYLGRELDGVMNYPLRTGIIDFLLKKGRSSLDYAINEVMFNAPKRVQDLQMNLLGTHDTERILTILGGGCADGKTNAELSVERLSSADRAIAVRRLKMAYTALATLPGIPAIFYADEAGMEGFKDPFNRRTYPWGKENSELLGHYRAVGDIRSSEEVFRIGAFTELSLTDEQFIFARTHGKNACITVINNSESDMIFTFEKPVRALLGGGKGKSITVAACSSEVLKTSADNVLIG